MAFQQITRSDIAGWSSLDAVSETLEKRGLVPRDDLGEDDELVMELAEDQFISLIAAGPTEDARSFTNRMTYRRHTNLVATNGFEEFTFISRRRSFGEAGRVTYQQFSFQRSAFTNDDGEKFSVLDKLNEIEYGDGRSVDALYDTRQVVSRFYEQFETLRTDLVTEVAGIPDDRGDAKQRYVQVQLDRLIFLYFIQKKNLLNFNTDYLLDKHEAYVQDPENDADVYEGFYSPLFFDVLAEDKQAEGFGTVPYLNGGLFSTSPVEESFPDAKLGATPDETNALFHEILEFLDEWNWHVDERLDIVEPKNLSPEILGHIFEQTVNQKEMGAYYTPEEITDYMARETIHPYLLQEIAQAGGSSYDSIDDVFGLTAGAGEPAAVADGGTLAQIGDVDAIARDDVATLYFDCLKEGRVLDPAVGSGAFLLAAQDVLVDIYLSCLEYFESMPPFERTPRIETELEAANDAGSPALYAKREAILNNLYGVDIDDGAVEICKLRLWLSMVADIENDPDEVEPLPNIDFNIRQGNSLVGYVDTLPTTGGKTTWDDWSVKDKFDEVIEAVEKHRGATTSSEAANWRRIAEQRMNQYRSDLNEDLAERMRTEGMEDIDAETLASFDAFHWIVEYPDVIDDGGFDMAIGNPPWEVLTPNREEFFTRYDERFRTYDADQKDAVQEELLADEMRQQEWEAYQKEIDTRAAYFNKSPDYKLQSPKVNGRQVASENDLSALFLERSFDLVSERGWTSLILPGFVFNGAIAKDLRQYLLDQTALQTTVGFENKGIFSKIDNRYRFGILTFRSGGTTDGVTGLFAQTSTDILERIDDEAAHIPRRVLESYSPNARIFPSVTSQEETDTLNAILEHPPLGDTQQPWHADILTKELHEPTDKGRLVESADTDDYPVYEGSNIYQFIHDATLDVDIDEPRYWSLATNDPDESARARVRQKAFNKGRLKKAIYEAFDGDETSKSQKAFVNDLLEEKREEPLGEQDIRPDWTEYRVGFRDVARATDERTMIATVLPAGVPCLHTLQTLRPYELEVNPTTDLTQSPLHNCYERIFTDQELFATVGLLNSVPFDFLMRTKIDTHIVKYKLEESQVPRLTEGDEHFEYIWTRAARLNCYGDAFGEMRDRLPKDIEPVTVESERRQLRAEIDAAAFHAYGLGPEEMQFVLDDFHLVSNPRLMDQAYLERVSDAYHDLA